MTSANQETDYIDSNHPFPFPISFIQTRSLTDSRKSGKGELWISLIRARRNYTQRSCPKFRRNKFYSGKREEMKSPDFLLEGSELFELFSPPLIAFID